jgi:hypothetical protein
VGSSACRTGSRSKCLPPAAAQSFALREAGHDLEAVAQNHAIGPVGVVLVELGGTGVLGQPVEIGE